MSAAVSTTDFNAARAAMIHSQLQPTGVIDERLVKAIADVRRELFVMPGREAAAYADRGVAISADRDMMAPLSLGLLLQRLSISSKDRVLVIGAGTGWSAAVVSRLAGATVALEEEAALAERARTLLSGVPVAVQQGPLQAGWPDAAPYDAILVDGAVARLPQSFADQLAEGGRLAAIIAGEDSVMRASIAVKAAGVLVPEPFFDADAPFLPGFQPVSAFRF